MSKEINKIRKEEKICYLCVCAVLSKREQKKEKKKKEWKYSIKGGQRKRGKIKGGK